MKVLVKTSNGYEWVTATVDKYGNIKYKYTQWYDILAVKGYTKEIETNVICKNCGKVVKSTLDGWQKHCIENEKNANCLECYSLARDLRNTQSQKVKFNEDGTITETTKISYTPRCERLSYCYREGMDTTPNKAKESCECKYFQCRKYGYQTIRAKNDGRYNFYGKFVTEKKLIDKGWSLISQNSYCRVYRWKKTCLYANVDSYGVVTRWQIKRRVDANRVDNFIYSTKLKKFARTDNNFHSVEHMWNVYYGSVAKDKVDKAEEVILAMYK